MSPTLREYLQMIDGSSRPELDRLMILFGRFFQIRDDFANLVMDEYQDSKGFCEDLDEGKWSFVLLHALSHASPQTQMVLRNVLMQRHAAGCATWGQKTLILEIMQKETHSLTYTAEALRLLGEEIEQEIQRVEQATRTPNPLLHEMIRKLRVDYGDQNRS
ncbi:geranylgeranyl pyrophosphate synthase [Aspergillus niger]|nr:geranylgeranyl pyrophosphate synthase [Aspergillus niger]